MRDVPSSSGSSADVQELSNVPQLSRQPAPGAVGEPASQLSIAVLLVLMVLVGIAWLVGFFAAALAVGVIALGVCIHIYRRLVAVERTERALRRELEASHERLRTTLAEANVGLWSWNTVTNVVEYSDSFLRQLGHTGGPQWTYDDWATRLHPDDRVDVAEAIRCYLAGETETYHNVYRLRCENGRYRWFESRASFDTALAGGERHLAGVQIDIHDQVSARQRVEAMIESAAVAMLVTDADGRIVLLNAGAEALFGYARDELLGRRVEMLLPEVLRASHRDQRTTYVADPEPRQMGAGRDLFGLHKNGSVVPISVGLSTIELDGEVRVLAAIFDLTERQRMENDLIRANTALEESNLELQQFAYVASHDLQTPLRTIAGFAQFLEEDYSDSLDEEGQRYIERIVGGCKRMQTLINDLLAYSRIESRAAPFEAVDLNEALDSALALIEGPIEDLHANIEHGSLPQVMGDRGQLAQLFMNIVGNGLKYHGDAPPRIRVSSRREGDFHRIEVADDGIGIEAQHAEKIFEIFKRLHSQTEYPGSGIGLAVCRRIVQRHGGLIGVESTPGTGSTFWFTVPA